MTIVVLMLLDTYWAYPSIDVLLASFFTALFQSTKTLIGYHFQGPILNPGDIEPFR